MIKNFRVLWTEERPVIAPTIFYWNCNKARTFHISKKIVVCETDLFLYKWTTTVLRVTSWTKEKPILSSNEKI